MGREFERRDIGRGILFMMIRCVSCMHSEYRRNYFTVLEWMEPIPTNVNHCLKTSSTCQRVEIPVPIPREIACEVALTACAQRSWVISNPNSPKKELVYVMKTFACFKLVRLTQELVSFCHSQMHPDRDKSRATRSKTS